MKFTTKYFYVYIIYFALSLYIQSEHVSIFTVLEWLSLPNSIAGFNTSGT